MWFMPKFKYMMIRYLRGQKNLYIPDHHKENGVQLGDPSHAVIFIKDGKMAVHFILRNTFVQLDELPPTTRPPRPPTTKPPKPSEKFCN